MIHLDRNFKLMLNTHAPISSPKICALWHLQLPYCFLLNFSTIEGCNPLHTLLGCSGITKSPSAWGSDAIWHHDVTFRLSQQEAVLAILHPIFLLLWRLWQRRKSCRHHIFLQGEPRHHFLMHCIPPQYSTRDRSSSGCTLVQLFSVTALWHIGVSWIVCRRAAGI